MFCKETLSARKAAWCHFPLIAQINSNQIFTKTPSQVDTSLIWQTSHFCIVEAYKTSIGTIENNTNHEILLEESPRGSFGLSLHPFVQNGGSSLFSPSFLPPMMGVKIFKAKERLNPCSSWNPLAVYIVSMLYCSGGSSGPNNLAKDTKFDSDQQKYVLFI